MANIYEPNAEQLQEWDQWLAGRPEKISSVARKFPPWKLYLLKSSNHRVTLVSFGVPSDDSSPVSLTVAVTGEFNQVAFERSVFGIKPEELEECELPGPTNRRA